jgi:hypothetical protein
VDVGRYASCVPSCAQDSSGELVETERFGTGQLDSAIDRTTHRDLGQRGGDVFRRDGLHERRRQANRVAIGAPIGDLADELEELRCADDRVGDRGCIAASWATFARM